MAGGEVERVLVISDEPVRARELADALANDTLTTFAVGEVAAACARLRQERFDAVVADMQIPDFSCVAVLRCAAAAQPPARVICVFGGPASSRTTWSAIREVAFAGLEREAGVEGVREQLQAALDAQLALTGMYRTGGGSRVAAGRRSWQGGRGDLWR